MFSHVFNYEHNHSQSIFDNGTQPHIQENTTYDDKQERTAYNDTQELQYTTTYQKIIQENTA